LVAAQSDMRAPATKIRGRFKAMLIDNITKSNVIKLIVSIPVA